MLSVLSPVIRTEDYTHWLYFWEINSAGKGEQRRIHVEPANVPGLQYVLWAARHSACTQGELKRITSVITEIVEQILCNYELSDEEVTSIVEAIDETAIKRPAPWARIAPPVNPRPARYFARPKQKAPPKPSEPEPEPRRRLLLLD
jgi:hypothetical protein